MPLTEESEFAWETLLVILSESLDTLPKIKAESLLEAIKAFPNEAFPEFELDILKILEGGAETSIERFEAEAEDNAEAETETVTRFFYLPDIEFPTAMKEISKSEFGKLPELDFESGNTLIVCRRRNRETLLFEFDSKIEDSFEIRFGGEIAETEAVEVFVSALAALTNIGKGGC